MKFNFVATIFLATVSSFGFGQQSMAISRQTTLPTIKSLIRTGPINGTYGGYVMVKYPQNVAEKIASDALSSPTAATMIASWGNFVRRIGPSGWTMWQVPIGLKFETIAERIKADPRVVTVEKLNRIYPLSDPNDLDFNAMETSEDFILSLGENDLSFRRLWHLDDDNAISAWATWPNKWYTSATKPANCPTIAVIDSGCDMGHPDFIGAGGTSTDSASGGQLDYAHSFAFRFGETTTDSTEDALGHGTHVTGICLAAANNGGFMDHGVIGTGYNSKGMILRVFDDSGNGSDADAAAAIFYAVDHGADIINMSLGTTNFSQLFQDAVTYAWQKGTLVVAAGNESGSGGGDLGPIYPAACSGCLAVSANGTGNIPATASYSGTGRYIDLAAPGGDVSSSEDGVVIQYVFSTSMRNDGIFTELSNNGQIYPPYTNNYSYLVGTSMACPNVSGAAGLFYGKANIRQADGWSNLRAYRALERSALDVMGAPHGAWEPTQGYGSLDMLSMLQEADARLATSGGIEGIVYSNGTPVSNAAVKAQKLNSSGVPAGTIFSTTSQADGSFRFDELPVGDFKVSATPFGLLKDKYAKVVPGSDFSGCDFWCGTITGDSTPPVVPTFQLKTVTATYIDVKHFGYDTETGLDDILWRIGTTSGGTEVLADKRIIVATNVNRLSGLSLVAGQTYYLQGAYKNGNGDVTTKTLAFTTAGAVTLSGSITLQDFGGSKASIPITVQLRTPGTTTVVGTYTLNTDASGNFTLNPGQTGTYDVAIKASHWLRAKVANVVVSGAATVGAVSLINGDVNGDNQVSASDQAQLSAAYRATPTSSNWNVNADLNGDNQVSASDQAILSKNYRKVGV